eukprot:tig00001333_g8201.t1
MEPEDYEMENYDMDDEAVREAEEEMMREQAAGPAAREGSIDDAKKRLSFGGIQRTPVGKRGEAQQEAGPSTESGSVPTPKRARIDDSETQSAPGDAEAFAANADDAEDEEGGQGAFFDDYGGDEGEGAEAAGERAGAGGEAGAEGAGGAPLDVEPEEVLVEDWFSDDDEGPAGREAPAGSAPPRQQHDGAAPAPAPAASRRPEPTYYMRRPPPTGDFMTVTGGPYGERLYIRRSTPGELAERAARARAAEDRASFSSEAALRELERKADAIVRPAGLSPPPAPCDLRSAQRLQRTLNRSVRDAGPRAAEGSGEAGPSGRSEGLWVQKYAPRCFADLLSDEATNRAVLQWLKAWDHVVFGKPRPAPQPLPERRPAGKRGAPGPSDKGPAAAFGPRGGRAGPQKGGGEDAEETRPSPRVILLAGPPGLGKTTLAHVAARHAGYRVLEINASDDRTGETLKRRLLDATEMRAMFAGNRPNCVVLDEIDGALEGSEGRGAISMLLKIVHAGDGKRRARPAEGDPDDEAPADEPDEEADEAAAEAPRRARKKGAAGASLKKLCRPIICVCNDPYVPALRPLRMEAQVFHFRRPPVSRLARRLKLICQAEGLSVDTRALTALCELTECDVRTCLNTLQFVRNRQEPSIAVTTHTLARAAVGHKDFARSHFAVWQSIFEAPKRGSDALAELARAGSGPSGAARGEAGRQGVPPERQRHWREMQERLYAHGDAEKVLEGVHENLHAVGFHDPLLTRAADALDWLCLGDLLAKRHASGFAPFPPLAVHYIARTPDAARVRLAFPSAITEARFKARQNGNVVRDFVRGAVCAATQPPPFSSALLDVLPALLRTLAVSTKKGNAQLLSGKEREEVREAALRMADYGVSFRAGHRPDGAFAFHIEPAIDGVCTFGGRCEASAAFEAMPDSVKSLLAKEARPRPPRAPPPHPPPQADAEASRRAEAAAAARVKGGPAPAAGPPRPPPPLRARRRRRLGGARQTRSPARRSSPSAPPPPPASPLPPRPCRPRRDRRAARSLAGCASPAPSAAPCAVEAGAEAGAGVRMADWMGLPKKRRETAAGPAEGREGKGKGKGAGEEKPGVHYRFHEGFTNAVRRTVLVRHLL